MRGRPRPRTAGRLPTQGGRLEARIGIAQSIRVILRVIADMSPNFVAGTAAGALCVLRLLGMKGIGRFYD
jgi:hypothetical protein